MLEGIAIKPLKKFPDERGWFSEVMREDWPDIISDRMVQANYSFTYPGIVRAWHRHSKGQDDHFLVLNGAAKICAYDDATRELDEVVSSAAELKIVKIPGNYWHGFRVVSNEPGQLLYFVNKLYDSKSPDEERRPWNDPTIIPAIINGNKSDPRVGTAWDWFLPPH